MNAHRTALALAALLCLALGAEPFNQASLPEPAFRASAAIDPGLPPALPRLQGVENEGVYIGSVRPVFRADPGVLIEAKVSVNGGAPRPFQSGEILYVAGEYRLDLLATRRSNGKTRQSSTYFELRRAVVAIAEIKADGVEASEARQLLTMFQEHLVATNLFSVPNVSRVDQIRTIMASGCNDTICAIEIGRGLDADYVVSGRLKALQGGQKTLEISVSHIERNTVEFSEKIPYPAQKRSRENLVRSSTKKVAARILGLSPRGFLLPEERRGAIARSAIFPGWGQIYEGHNASGLSFMAAGGLAMANTLLTYQNFIQAQQSYNGTIGLPAAGGTDNTFLINQYLFQQRKTQLLQAEASYHRSLYLLGGVWLFNLTDIVFFPEHSYARVTLSVPESISYREPPAWNVGLHWAF